MSKKKTLSFLCLTSVRSAYSDHFLSICQEVITKEVLNTYTIYISRNVFAKSEGIVAKNFDQKNFNLIEYNKSKIICSIQSIFKLMNNFKNAERLFIYGENPFHAFILLILKIRFKNIYVFFKLADPEVHEGVNKLLTFIHYLSKIILVYLSDIIIVSSTNNFKDINTLIYKISTDKLKIAQFGNLINLKTIANNTSLNSYVNRKFDIIFYGRSERYKGIDKFIEVIKIIISRMPNAKILIISKIYIQNTIPNNLVIINQYLEDMDFCNYLNDSKIGLFLYKHSTGSHVVQNINLFGGWAIVNKVGYLQDCIKINVNGDTIEKDMDVHSVAELILRRLNEMGNNKILPQTVQSKSFDIFDKSEFSSILLGPVTSARRKID